MYFTDLNRYAIFIPRPEKPHNQPAGRHQMD